MFYEKKAKLMERAINHLNEAWDVIYECQEIEMKQVDPEYAVEFQEMMDSIIDVQNRIENELDATQAMVDMAG